MNLMMDAMPERTFDVGIAEGHADHLLWRHGERRLATLLQYLFFLCTACLR